MLPKARPIFDIQLVFSNYPNVCTIDIQFFFFGGTTQFFSRFWVRFIGCRLVFDGYLHELGCNPYNRVFFFNDLHCTPEQICVFPLAF